jgi:hypothetical protein
MRKHNTIKVVHFRIRQILCRPHENNPCNLGMDSHFKVWSSQYQVGRFGSTRSLCLFTYVTIEVQKFNKFNGDNEDEFEHTNL